MAGWYLQTANQVFKKMVTWPFSAFKLMRILMCCQKINRKLQQKHKICVNCVMKSKPVINVNENTKRGNPGNTEMKCCDSWRHISDTWEVQSWSKANKFVASSPHLQMEYSHCNPSSDERQINCLIYFSQLFNTIIEISSKMGCFCCKTACFFLFGLAVSDQEEEKIKGKNKKRRQAHL